MSSDRSFLLLHGFGSHRPPEHWQSWLSLQLAAAGLPVIYPQLPVPDRPIYEDWAAALLLHLGELARLGTPERIVLCQSLSCLLWLRACAESSITDDLVPDRLVLVSPPARDRIPWASSGFGIVDPEPDALRASAREEIRFVGSDNDHDYNPQGVKRTYADPLGLPCDLVPGAGHISSDDGFGPWLAMLAWCQDPGGPIG